MPYAQGTQFYLIGSINFVKKKNIVQLLDIYSFCFDRNHFLRLHKLGKSNWCEGWDLQVGADF